MGKKSSWFLSFLKYHLSYKKFIYYLFIYLLYSVKAVTANSKKIIQIYLLEGPLWLIFIFHKGVLQDGYLSKMATLNWLLYAGLAVLIILYADSFILFN